MIGAYKAALYCEDCTRDLQYMLRRRVDNGDSGDFPQLFPAGETDAPSACDACGEWLPESLTSDGVAYVVAELREWVLGRRAHWPESSVDHYRSLASAYTRRGMARVWSEAADSIAYEQLRPTHRRLRAAHPQG